MKAILIDPKQRSLTEIDIKDGDSHEEIVAAIECRIMCVGTYLDDNDAVFIDDEGLLYDQRDQYFFRLDDRVINTTNTQILAGRGLVVGSNLYDGSSRDAQVSIEKLSEAIRWIGRGRSVVYANRIEVVLEDGGER